MTSSNPKRVGSEIDRRAGEAIARLRKRRGLTRTALAAACDLSPTQLAKYESGANRLSLTRAHAIAQALETDIVAFLAETAQDAAAPSLSTRVKAAELMRLGLEMEEPLLDSVLSVVTAAARRA